MKNNYCEYIADRLSAWGDIHYRSLFGGFGLYKDDQIFGLTCDDTLYLKTDKQSQKLFESEGCKPFIYEAKNKTVKMSYWSAPDAFFDSPDNAGYWADIAYQGISGHIRAYQAGLCSAKKTKL